MRSTGISAFSYPKLVAALGLPPRLPKVYDTGQMLALPDLDVLDALGCDVVTIQDGLITNAFDQPENGIPTISTAGYRPWCASRRISKPCPTAP